MIRQTYMSVFHLIQALSGINCGINSYLRCFYILLFRRNIYYYFRVRISLRNLFAFKIFAFTD